MSMSLMFFVILTIVILMLNKKKFGTYYSSFFFVALPYPVITFINNIFMCNIGFKVISDKTISILSLGMVLFFLGTMIGHNGIKKKKYRRTKQREFVIAEGTLIFIVVVSSAIVFVDLLLCIKRYGLVNYIAGGELYARGQIAEHLRLVLAVVSIILIEEYIKKRKLLYLLLFIISLGLVFSSFIKYHVIAVLLAIIIYFALTHREYLKRIGIIFGLLIIASFILTYVITFKSYNENVARTFYGNHLWGYIAGGIINIDNGKVFFNARLGELSIFLWIIEMLTSFPSMITNKLFGFAFTDYAFSQKTVEFNLGASTSNVICIPGAAYIQGGLIGIAFFVFIAGIIIEHVFFEANKINSMAKIMATSIFLSYCMLSFFGSFFELPAPWETIVLAVVVVKIVAIKFVVKR